MLCLIAGIYGQQPENSGFEAWEVEVTGTPNILEPVDWSTVKTSDNSNLNLFAPVYWEMSTDAHTGSYSLKLFNIEALPGLIVAGTITNGRVHSDLNPDNGYIFTDTLNAKWHTQFTTRPDSLVFWMKFIPQGLDTAQAQVLLHVGTARLPMNDQSIQNRIGYAKLLISGTYENWTRFSIPIEYFNDESPEYLLMIFNSGNGTTPVEGSYALFDDITLVDNPQAADDYQAAEISVVYKNKTLIISGFPESARENSSVEIIDMFGRTVLAKELNSEHTSIQQFSLKPGIYIVNLMIDEKIISRKIFID
jgi:hypothetical protein